MKKRWIICIALIAAALALALLGTVPVYPAFQRQAASMQALRRTLRDEDMQYPACEQLLDPEFRIELDGRTVLAAPVGYQIEGAGNDPDAPVRFVFSGSRKSRQEASSAEEVVYRDVPIRIRRCGDAAGHAGAHWLEASFFCRGVSYELRASFGESAQDGDVQLTPEAYAALAAHAQEALLDQCRQMIGGAGEA